MEDLTERSKHSSSKIKRIKNYWLGIEPQEPRFVASDIRHLMIDGTYFNHDNCLIAIMNGENGIIVEHTYCQRENYDQTRKMLERLKAKGVEPVSVTLDGNTSVIRAIKVVYPNIIIQRCLVHIQRQGLSWLRKYPKSRAGKELKILFITITNIRNRREKGRFVKDLKAWEDKYGEWVLFLPSEHKVYGDLQRARSMIFHALPDMFHYLDNPNISFTTNKLEGYFSLLKTRYKGHRGMSKKHRKNYLKWYIYFNNKR